MKKPKNLTRTELAYRVSARLRDSGYEKSVTIPKQVLHVSDDFGNEKKFTIGRGTKEVGLNHYDALAVINAALDTIIDAIAQGETVYFKGFGSLDLKYRAPRKVRMPGTDDWVDVKGRYVPKFTFGDDLRRSANLYEMSLSEENIDPLKVEEEIEDGEE